MALGIESTDAREVFRPIALVYRRRRRVVLLLIFPMSLATGFLMVYLAAPFSYVAGISFFALIVAGSLLWPKLRCPVCRRDTNEAVDRFCPECGSDSIKRDGGPRSAPKCMTCGKELWLSKGRSGAALFSVCFCTHCGAHLADEGL